MARYTPAAVLSGPTVTLPFASDTTAYLRGVINAAGQVAIANASQRSAGVAWDEDVDVSESDAGAFRLHGHGLTLMIAAKAIAAGALVFAAAAGKVTDAQSGVLEGRALSTASADGDIIVVATQGFSGIVPFTYTIASGEASSGTATIDSGLGVAVEPFVVLVPASGVQDWPGAVAKLTGSDLGKITITESPDTWTAGDRFVGYFIVGAVTL